jgi:uncharacterized protein YgiM (DUF1202 family)
LRHAVLIALLLLAFSAPAAAKSPGVVTGRNVAVHEGPAAKSPILVTLDKGKALTVLAKRPGWLQVKVQLDKTFSFTGWVPEKFVKWKEGSAAEKPVIAPRITPKQPPLRIVPPQAPMPIVAPVSRPSPVPTAAPPPDLDRFFAPAPVQPAPTAIPTPIPTPAFTMVEEEPSEGPVVPRLNLSLGAGFVFYQYKLTTGGATLFSYNLPGVGLDAGAVYWFWNPPGGRFRSGAGGSFQYGLYRYSTDVKDNSGTTVSNASAKGTSYDAILRIPLEASFGSPSRPVVLGVNAGLEYLRFALGDVSGTTGPLSLYVGQSSLTVLAGADVRFLIPGTKSLQASAGADLLAIGWVKEDPRDASGGSPKEKLGYVPRAEFTWIPMERHHLGLGYKLRLQNYSFSGTASRVGTNNVVDGRATTALHDVFLRYEYLFGN